MNTKKNVQLADLIIQALLLANVIVPVVLSAFIHPGMLFWSLAALLPLGIWQLFSALILGWVLSDKFRRLYLITAVTFSSLFFSVGKVVDQLGVSFLLENLHIAFFTGIFLSFAGAIYYFNYSYRYYRSGYQTETL